eukprot:12934582-Ditylum_brightwellii.AAC.1
MENSEIVSGVLYHAEDHRIYHGRITGDKVVKTRHPGQTDTYWRNMGWPIEDNRGPRKRYSLNDGDKMVISDGFTDDNDDSNKKTQKGGKDRRRSRRGKQKDEKEDSVFQEEEENNERSKEEREQEGAQKEKKKRRKYTYDVPSELHPTVDNDWMEEHFDGIDAIEFYNSRLSRRKRRRNRDSGKEGFNKKENVSSSPLSIPKTEERHEKARRALILRCWERAVHAASCDVACDSSSVANPSNNDDFYFFSTQSQCDVDSASHDNDGSCDAIEKEGMPDQLTTERMSKVENIEDEALGRCSRLGIKLPWSEKTNDTGRNHDYLTSKIHQSEEEDRKEEGKRGTAGTDVPL